MRSSLKCARLLLGITLLHRAGITRRGYGRGHQDRRSVPPDRRRGSFGLGNCGRAQSWRLEIANNAMPDINMTMAKNAGIKSMGGAKITLIFKDTRATPLWAPTWPRSSSRRQGPRPHGRLPQCGHQGRQRRSRAVRDSLINDSSTLPS